MSKKNKTNWFTKHWKYILGGTVAVMVIGGIMLAVTKGKLWNRQVAQPIEPFERLDPELEYGDASVAGSVTSYMPVSMTAVPGVNLEDGSDEDGSTYHIKDTSCDIQIQQVLYSSQDTGLNEILGETDECLAVKFTVTPYGKDEAFQPSSFVRMIAVSGETAADMWTLVKLDGKWVEIPWNTACEQSFEQGETYEAIAYTLADPFQSDVLIQIMDTDSIVTRLELSNMKARVAAVLPEAEENETGITTAEETAEAEGTEEVPDEEPESEVVNESESDMDTTAAVDETE